MPLNTTKKRDKLCLAPNQWSIVFSFNRKTICISKIELKAGESNQISDIGEVLHEISKIFTKDDQ